MQKNIPNIQQFRKQVRLATIWRQSAIGLGLAGLVALILAGLDALGWIYVEPMWAVSVLAAGLAAGALSGCLKKIPSEAIVLSVDRRAGLQDRLATAYSDHESLFTPELQADAQDRVAALQPRRLFPLTWSRWHTAAAVMPALSGLLLFLTASGALLGEDAKRDKETMQQQGEAIDRVVAPIKEPQLAKDLKPQEAGLAKELETFKKELDKGRMKKDEALVKANELMEKADQLAKSRFQEAEKTTETVEDKLRNAKEEADKSSGMTTEQRRLQEEQQKKLSEALQRQIDDLKRQLEQDQRNGGANQSELKQQLQQAQKELQQLQLSKEAQKAFEDLMKSTEYQELLEMARKLAAESKQASENGTPQSQMSKEQLEELRKQLEELAKKLKDDAFAKEMIEQMKKALKEMKAGQCMGGACVGLMNLFGLPGKGGVSKDQFFANTGRINKHEEEQDSKGKTSVTSISGLRREDQGEEAYIEVRGPASIGERSKVPYIKVLPKYRSQAEAAMRKQKISRENEKRVKTYFQSLGGN
ncbi:MAG: hypothetical protein HONBIEJF_01676 [Fimbriimonadaceae bacterium]|nr:hypothetical protein [Fimbriimonadaceae bacterium]